MNKTINQTINNVIQLPFSLIINNGLGIANSTLSTLGSLLPSRQFGNAKIKSYVNMTNGNLILQDKILRFPNCGFPIEFGYYYNSLNASWTLGFGRQIIKNESSQTLTIKERDGNLQNYTLNQNDNRYYADVWEDGRPSIFWDDTLNAWFWYHPKTHEKDRFNQQGFLTHHYDANGNIISYEYENNELSAVISATQTRYELKRNNHLIEVHKITDKDDLLHTFTFDENKKLIKSETADHYTIYYDYSENKLTWIMQSDLSEMHFSYDSENKLKSIQVGDDASNNINQFDYEYNKTEFIDAKGYVTTVNYDGGLLKSIEQDKGTHFKSQNTTKLYEFDKNGQLKGQSFEDNTTKTFSYENKNGLLKSVLHRDGRVTEYIYTNNYLSAIKEYPPKKMGEPRVTYFLYEELTEDNALLRFKISPEGRVIEYQYDESLKLITYERQYLNDYYKDKISPPNFQKLNDWSQQILDRKQLNPFSLTYYEYDKDNNLNKKTNYNQVSEVGCGITDKEMAIETYEYDHYGYITKQTKKCGGNATFEINSIYNDCHNIISEVKGNNPDNAQKTEYAYIDNKSSIIFPNGKVTIFENDTQGLAILKKEIANDEVRTTHYQRDVNGSINVTVKSNGHYHFDFVDHARRTFATVTNAGLVTENIYNDQYHYQIETVYANPVNVEELLAKTNEKNLYGLLQKDVNLDRKNFKFYGVNDKIHYSIDAEYYLTEYEYDVNDNQIAKIQYREKISSSELDQLLVGENIKRVPDRKKDWINSCFWDNDNQLLAEQNEDGYVTVYLRDAGKRICEQINYSIPNLQYSSDLNEIKPVDNENDSHKYFAYAGKNTVYIVDAEGYLSVIEYTADNKIATQTRYATKITAEWFQNTSNIPKITENSKDQKTIFHYDELGRLKKIEEPSGRTSQNEYNEMDLLTKTIIFDNLKLGNKDADTVRGNAVRFDMWGRPIAIANHFVFEKISNEPELAESIWKNNAVKYIYDSNNLKIKSIDQYNNATIYYYNAANLPVLRVSPTGTMREWQYNAFGEQIAKRRFKNRMPSSLLANLNGGFITRDLVRIIEGLRDPSKDIEDTYVRNRVGCIKSKIDVKGNLSSYEFDARRQVISESKQLEKDKSIKIEYCYDMRDNSTKTVKSTEDAENISLKSCFDNHLDKLTEYVDELGCKSIFKYDKLGRQTEVFKSTSENEMQRECVKTYDAFNRILSNSDANENITSFDYSDDARETVIKTSHTVKKESRNCFDECIKIQNGLSHNVQFTHAPDGQIRTTENAINQFVRTEYDLKGNILNECNALSTITGYEYDSDNKLSSIIKDSGGKNIPLSFLRNGLGQVETQINAVNTMTMNDYDCNGNLIQTIAEADDVNRITSYEYNAQNKVIRQIKGTKHENNLWQKDILYDGFARPIAVVIDPDDLAIKTSTTYDSSGNSIKQIDELGNQQYTFYDIRNQKRFNILEMNDHRGLMTEWQYTKTGKIKSIIHYSNLVDLKSISETLTLADIASLISTSRNDTVAQYYYDEDDREKYKIHLVHLVDLDKWQGIVSEKVYDDVGNIIKTKKYANMIDIDSLNNDSLETILAEINDDEDRVDYYLYDEVGNEIAKISKDGCVCEKSYDPAGNMISSKRYATLAKEIDNIDGLRGDELKKTLTGIVNNLISNKEDRIDYYVYDALGRETDYINAEGTVFRKTYDNEDRIVETCLFKEKINHQIPYEELKKVLSELKSDKDVDAIKHITFNGLGEMTMITDPLGYSEYYDRDDVGNLTAYTNRKGQTWTNYYDRANRLRLSKTPECNVTRTAKSLKTSGLDYFDDRAIVQKSIEYDDAGNKNKVIEAFNTAEAREVQMLYDARGKVIETRTPNVSFDILNGERTTEGYFPLIEAQGTLVTKIIYNTRGSKVAEKDEANRWCFYLRNNLDDIIFFIDKNKGITQYDYNAFGQVQETIRYANPLQISTEEMILQNDDAITVNIKQDLLQNIQQYIVPNENEDRKVHYDYDCHGRLIQVTDNPVWYYVDEFTLDYQEPQSIKKYNAFGDCVYDGRRIEANKWVKKRAWYDHAGRCRADLNERNYITLYEYNSSGSLTRKIEYAEALKEILSSTITYDQLVDKIIPSDKDREILYYYDQAQQKKSEINKKITSQIYKIDGDNKPVLINDNERDIIKHYSWSETGKLLKVSGEDAIYQQYYYDERDHLIGERGIACKNIVDGSTTIPCTLYKRDFFGEIAVLQKSALGCEITENETDIPDLIINTPNDLHEEISLYNNRGLLSVKQDAEENLIRYYYSPTRKLSRQQQEVYLWEDMNLRMHVDENQYLYDNNDNLTVTTERRDDASVENFIKRDYNAFNEIIEEQDGVHPSGVIRKYDKKGRNWFSNEENGGQYISIYDLNGKEKMRLQAPGDDLSQLDYNFLNSMISWDAKRLERTTYCRDDSGAVIEKKMPYAYKHSSNKIITSNEVNSVLDLDNKPTYKFERDRWNNITAETDFFDRETKRYYDKRNCLTDVFQPEVKVINENSDEELLIPHLRLLAVPLPMQQLKALRLNCMPKKSFHSMNY